MKKETDNQCKLEIDDAVRKNNNKIIPIALIGLLLASILFLNIGTYVSTLNYNDQYNEGYLNGLSIGYNQGYLNGTINGNETGYEQGLIEGNETGYEQGLIEGNETGYLQGWLIGNTSGYIDGWIAGYDEGYNTGYSDGYNDGYIIGWDEGYNEGYINAFLENRIIFNGYSNGNITVYNSDQNTSEYLESFSNIKNSDIFSIESYENETANINATISNIQLYNSSIIQDTFIETDSQTTYTATSTVTLYQCLTITENLNLTSITLKGTTLANARLRIRLYQNNNGVVGSLITTLHTDSVARSNGLQTMTIRFNYPLSIGCYFVGIQTTSGSFRIATSYGTGINNYVTLYSSSLANIDYALNYTIAPPTYSNINNFIDYGVLNANNVGFFVSLPFVNNYGHIDSFSLKFGSIDTKIIWNWFNLTFNINFNITFGIDTELTENCTLTVDSLALRNNQSTNFWGYNTNGQITANITYYTQTDILATNFGVTINGYSFRFDLIEPGIFQKGYEYFFNLISMNATIYDTIGTTWICNFQMEYSINGTIMFELINDLYIFDVFRN